MKISVFLIAFLVVVSVDAHCDSDCKERCEKQKQERIAAINQELDVKLPWLESHDERMKYVRKHPERFSQLVQIEALPEESIWLPLMGFLLYFVCLILPGILHES